MAEAAFQKALKYANERKQGKAPGHDYDGMSPISAHPDTKRNLLTMKALTTAARAICYMTAGATDRSHRVADPAEKKYQAERAALLTPIAKAFSSDVGVEVASLGVQIHGGMGFIEETGAAQFLRDSRIVPIYEGTNGIQAIDLVTRKLPMSGGDTIKREILDMYGVIAELNTLENPGVGQMAFRLGEAVEAFERATAHLAKALPVAPIDALACATPYLRLFGIVRGGTCLAALAIAAEEANVSGKTNAVQSGWIAVARFFAENIATFAGGLATTIIAGASSVNEADLALIG
jgi:butyryl-CoA dehydrogenase